MAKRDGREIARGNDERVLKAIFKMGPIRTRALAALLWMPRVKRKGTTFEPITIEVSATARRMAQRTLQRLRQQHKVIWIQAPDGSTIYGLSEAGARQLVNLGLPAKSGKDQIRHMSLSYFHHRRIANEIAIGAILQGYRTTSELEIAMGKWFGGMEGVVGKKPDVVARDGKDTWFIEVERSARNKAGYDSLISALLAMWPLDKHAHEPAELPDGHKLHQVVFVASAAFIARVCSDLKNVGWTENMISQRIGGVELLYVTMGKFIVYEGRAEMVTHA